MPRFVTYLMGLLWLVACGDAARVQVQTRHRGATGWRGAYLTDPKTVAEDKGRGYARLLFVSPHHAQLQVIDRRHPDLMWMAALSSHSVGSEAVRIRCESQSVFRVARGGTAQNTLLYRRVRGRDASFTAEGAEKEAVEKMLLESHALGRFLPRKIRECAEELTTLDARVLEGGTVILAARDEEVRFHPDDDAAYAAVARAFAEIPGALSVWRGIGLFPDRTNLYESLVNRLIPSPQAHRFFRLREWSLEKGEGGLELTGAVSPRPSLKDLRRRLQDDFTLNQIERGTWIEPVPREYRLHRGNETISGESAGEGVRFPGPTPPGEDEVLRLEVSYDIPDQPGVVLLQTITLQGLRPTGPAVVEVRAGAAHSEAG